MYIGLFKANTTLMYTKECFEKGRSLRGWPYVNSDSSFSCPSRNWWCSQSGNLRIEQTLS